MKKFLVFLVALIATVCIGVTFYQFAKNDEVISVNTAPIYVNYGEKLSLDAIGFSRKEASKQTTFDFNAGGDEVTSIIKFDQATQCYVPTNKGGVTTIKISTSNRKYKMLTIDVYVGVGTEENPFYISNEDQLFEITNANIDQAVKYKLVNDIEIKNSHLPIGFIDNQNNEFKGTFDGGYNTISNLKIESCKFGGLFGIIASTGSVSNLNIENITLDGEFDHAGAVAGKCYGKVDKVMIKNPTINNNKGVTGGAIGTLETDTNSLVTASIFRTGVVIDQENLTISAKGMLGGLVGKSDCAKIHACYTNVSLKNTSNEFTGGLVGEFVIDQNAKIYESYTICKIESIGTCGNIAGNVEIDPFVNISNLDTDLILVGLYFNKSLNRYDGLGNDSYDIASSTSFAVNGKTSEDLLKKHTYIYYLTNNSNVVYWDKVWNCVDGEYPTLVFVNKFEDITINDNGNVTNPEIEDPEASDPETTDPENADAEVIEIDSKNDLKKYFQTGNKVSGKFIITADIDLGGMQWIPVDFSGTINGNNHTISNFTIVRYSNLEASDYRGVFYRLSSALVKNITFNKVSFLNENAIGVGVVAGYIGADVKLSNVKVSNSNVTINATYAGGVVGVINGLAMLENISTYNTNVYAINAAGIVGRVSESATLNNCVVTSDSTIISGIKRAGGIAVNNYGAIKNSSVNGNIKCINDYTEGYVGGIVAYNYNILEYNTCWAKVSASNQTSNLIFRIGGISSVNYGIIRYCDIYSKNISADSTSKVYIGGLTAENQGTIMYCVADVNNIGTVNDKLYIAGLAVLNTGNGTIKGCFNFGNLSGYIVAGLVISNDNNATIDGCMAGKSVDDGIIDETNEWKNRVRYKGYIVSTFAYIISSGTISNCLVSASLECQDNSGWVAGFAGFMPYTKGSKNQPDKYGTITSCIANVSLENSTIGKIYCDIATCDLMRKDRCTGTITNSVISSELSTKYIQSTRDKNWLTGTIYSPGSGSNFVAKTINEMTKISTFTQAGSLNFDISTNIYYDVFADSYGSDWVKPSANRIPIPGTIFNVFGNLFGESSNNSSGDITDDNTHENTDNSSSDIFDDNKFVEDWLA